MRLQKLRTQGKESYASSKLPVRSGEGRDRGRWNSASIHCRRHAGQGAGKARGSGRSVSAARDRCPQKHGAGSEVWGSCGRRLSASVSSWTQIIFFLVRDGKRSALPPGPGFAHPVNGCPELPAAGGVLGCISVVVWGEAFR